MQIALRYSDYIADAACFHVDGIQYHARYENGKIVELPEFCENEREKKVVKYLSFALIQFMRKWVRISCLRYQYGPIHRRCTLLCAKLSKNLPFYSICLEVGVEIGEKTLTIRMQAKFCQISVF